MEITEQDMSSAVHFLRFEAPEKTSKAKEKKAIAEGYVKTLRAHLFLSSSGTVAEREAKALSSDDYKGALNKLSDAIRNLEFWERKCEAAKMTIDAWRTQEKNKREGIA